MQGLYTTQDSGLLNAFVRIDAVVLVRVHRAAHPGHLGRDHDAAHSALRVAVLPSLRATVYGRFRRDGHIFFASQQQRRPTTQRPGQRSGYGMSNQT